MNYPDVRISDIAEINPGIDLQQFDLSFPVSFVPMQAVSEVTASIETLETRSFAEVRRGFTPFQENDIIFAKITPSMENGKIALARGLTNGIGYGSTEFHVIRPTYLIEPEYLFFFMRQPQFRAAAKQRMRGAAGQQRVPDQFFNTYRIPLPPLSEQHRIVAILRKADELSRLRREAQREAEALLPALFNEMFGNPEINPKNWETSTLEKVCTRITDGTHQPPPFVEKGIPFLFVSNIVNGFIDFNTDKYISSKTFSYLMKRCPVEVGDILYSTVGSYGIAVLVETSNPFSFQRHIAHIKPDHNKIDANFLCTMLNSSYVRSQADKRARGIAQKTVNLSEIAQFRIIVPPLEIQLSFTERTANILGVQNTQSQYLKYIDELFSSLLAQAFSGELTAGWREQRREELTLEAAERDLRLRERGARRSTQVISPPTIPSSSTVGAPTVVLRGPRDAFLDCLSEEQQRVWQSVQESEGAYITAGIVGESYDLPLVRTRQTLELLASAGLLMPVTLWNSEISDFMEAYRLVRAERSEDQRGDDAYADDTTLLAEAS